MAAKQGGKEHPRRLKTSPQESEYEMYLAENEGQKVIVCVVGKTTLQQHGDWLELGSADEQKTAKAGTVEAWGDPPTTQSMVGMGIKRDSVAGLAGTCHL